MINTYERTGEPRTEIDLLMERCRKEGLMGPGGLDDLKRRLAEPYRLTDVPTAAVDALLCVRGACDDLMSLTVPTMARQTVSHREQIELWELTAYRCLRALLWAERMGVFRKQYAKVRRRGVEPILRDLRLMKAGVLITGDEWRVIRSSMDNVRMGALGLDNSERRQHTPEKRQ